MSLLQNYIAATLPTPGIAGRLVVSQDAKYWVDTGIEWREATQEEAEFARRYFATR